MEIKAFFDQETWTLTYVVWDKESRDAVIIDPVWDYEPGASTLTTQSVSQVIEFVNKSSLKVHLILETHAHADHVSASQLLKKEYPQAKIAIGSGIREVQKTFKGIFNLPNDFPTDGSQFDKLLEDGELVSTGSLKFKVIYTPGHTPACSSYLFGDALFTGDSLFMPDHGTGRCDFPAGSAATLYDSVTKKIYTLPEQTRIFVGHDYQVGGRELLYMTTVGESKKTNAQLTGTTTKEQYVKFRETRDKTLSAPRLLLPSIQVNINAGSMPTADSNGVSYLRIPIRTR